MEDEKREDRREREKSDEDEQGENDQDDGMDNESLRELILEQLANLEQSDVSDDGSYKVRLSCILEDDESESSGAFQKDGKKTGERNKESEKGPPGSSSAENRLSGGTYDSETSDDTGAEQIRVTDLDDDETLVDVSLPEKTDDKDGSEESDEFTPKPDAYQIKKLKSSDNLHKRPFVVRKRELSSDSSDLDISVTNSADGTISDVKMTQDPGQDTQDREVNVVPKVTEVKDSGASSKVSESDVKTKSIEPKQEEEEEEEEQEEEEEEEKEEEEEIEEEKKEEEKKEKDESGKTTKNTIEVLDNETLSSIFAKVSKTYLEKTKGPVKWDETERVDRPITPVGDRSRSRERPDEYSLQDAHIRGTSPKEYNPPIPPETYLWEELKRLRERGGYPWTYLDKPPFDEATWKKYMEHVYEPINPPPPTPDSIPPREDLVKATTSSSTSKPPSIPDTTERHLSRTTPEVEFSKRGQEIANESNASEDMEVEMISLNRELQSELEEEMSEQKQTASTATETGSTPAAAAGKTSLKASKMFKDIPIKHGNLGKTRREQMRVHAQEIQDKLRNHAGRIRTKLNDMHLKNTLRRQNRSVGEGETTSKFKLPEMHAPKISFPDRSKFKLPEKAKFHLPESAKLHFPDASKFHLPERPKFNLAEKIHLPETAKFHLPDKAKLHLPERPKLHLPERAKLHLPDRAKLRMPDKTKLHLNKPKLPKLEKPKFHFPERAKLHLPDKAKFHLPERPKFHLPDKSKFQLPEKAKMIRPKLETLRLGRSKEPETPPVMSMSKFELKSYPKLFSKNAKDYTTSSPKQTRGRTPPPRMLDMESASQKPSTSNAEWMKNDDEDVEDEDSNVEPEKAVPQRVESLFDYREKDIEYIDDYDKETMADRIADNILEYETEKRKTGVLEEINSDEYFLRQKGISQDDIDMGNYLSREIREAFRSSGPNALAKMDYIDSENLDPKYQVQPTRPARTNSVKKKKSILKKTYSSDPSLNDDGYRTYPPRRPGRKSRSQSKSLLNEEAAIAETIVHDSQEIEGSRDYNDDVNLSRYDNVHEDEISEYYKSVGPAREYVHYKVPRKHGIMPSPPSPPTKRKSDIESEFPETDLQEAWNKFEVLNNPPVPVARKKNKKKKAINEILIEPEQLEQIPQQIMPDFDEVVQQLHETDSPVPPKRTRSSGSRSFVTEEEVSCSFQSELEKVCLENEIIPENASSVMENSFAQSEPDFVPPNAIRCEVTDLDDVGFGYATVGKPTVLKPQRQKKKEKPERPPPPKRKKEVSVPIYNTYPRRVPVRPSRNYSTLKPARPPRRNKLMSKSSTFLTSPFRTYCEIEGDNVIDSVDQVEISGSSKELQTEKVIEKMKGRPLPPPPRPPRQKSKGPDEPEPTEEELISLSILKDDEFPIVRQVTSFVHEPPVEKELVEEITASTQTDAAAEEFTLETEDESGNIMQEFSREQLRIQQAFLEEMKKEEEMLRQRGAENDVDLEDAELKAEVIRQIQDIIAEEKRILEGGKRKEECLQPSEPKETTTYREDSAVFSGDDKTERAHSAFTDVDMGYASLDRKGTRQEQEETSKPPELPPKMSKLQVRELEAETITVHEVQADQIFVKELQSNRVASQDIDNTGGNTVLGNVNLSPAFIDQIVAKIPWETLRESQERTPSKPQATTESIRTSPPVRPQRRHRRPTPPCEDSDEEPYSQPTRRGQRRHQKPQYSSDDEPVSEKITYRPPKRGTEPTESITELSIRLAKACTEAGVETVRTFVQTNTAFARTLDREMCVQVILCIAIALVAAFFLFGYDAKIIHLNRWDFQFPPQPPNREQ